jgi:type I protein arginine methyltransferase
MQHFVSLSTSPYKKYTHWKQTVFYFDDTINVKKGDKLSGSIAVRKSRQNFRELDVKISYHFDNGYEKFDHPGQLYKVK